MSDQPLPSPSHATAGMAHSARADNCLHVVCLCAAWCGTCKDYEATFADIARAFPDCHFQWIDIEEQADAVDDFDVENFPTLLLTQGTSVRFLGTVTPHADTLRRLVQVHAQSSDSQPGVNTPEARHLAQRLKLLT